DAVVGAELDLAEGDSVRLAHDAIAHERVAVRQHLVLARFAEDAHREVDELARALPDDDLLHRSAEAVGDGAAPAVGAPVGVAVGARQGGLRRLDPERRWSERVLIGGELDRAVDAELALQLLDGLARLVRNDFFDVRRNQRKTHVTSACGYEPR